MSTAAERDLEAWRAWKRIRSPRNLDEVLKRLNAVIQNQVNRWSGTLARPILELEAKRLAVLAIKDYRPSMGAALATHVTHRLKKLSRLNYSFSDVARAPEYLKLRYGTYQSAKAQLEDTLGREATSDELADELKWSHGALAAFEKTQRREFLESGETPPAIFDRDDGESGMTSFIFYDLSPIQKKIFEHTTGFNSAEVLSNPEIMKKLGISQGVISYQKRLMTNKIDRIMGGRKW